MTVFLHAATNTEPISQEVKSYIDASLCSLQHARLALRNEATLADIFKGRNPYFLQSTRKVAYQLVSYCLDYYLLLADEILFANFSREFSAFMARRSAKLLKLPSLINLFAQDDLPLRIELLEAYDRLYNRLSHRFFEEFCDEDGLVEWEQLAAFIYND